MTECSDCGRPESAALVLGFHCEHERCPLSNASHPAPAPSAGNESGTDYRAKALDLAADIANLWGVSFSTLEVDEEVLSLIAFALAGSAAAERERCEAIARRANRAYRQRHADGDVGQDWIDAADVCEHIADAIAATGNWNGGATERKRTIKECADFLLAEAQREGNDAVAFTLKRAAENIAELAETKGEGR